jgi:hypothetical protein
MLVVGLVVPAADTVLLFLFDQSGQTLTLPRKKGIELTANLLIFGPPLDGVRHYQDYFRDHFEGYGQNIYQHFDNETLGDFYTASPLGRMDQTHILQLKDSHISCLLFREEVVNINETKDGAKFLRVFTTCVIDTCSVRLGGVTTTTSPSST